MSKYVIKTKNLTLQFIVGKMICLCIAVPAFWAGNRMVAEQPFSYGFTV